MNALYFIIALGFAGFIMWAISNQAVKSAHKDEVKDSFKIIGKTILWLAIIGIIFGIAKGL